MDSDAAINQAPRERAAAPWRDDAVATTRWRRAAPASAMALLLTALLAACGSSSGATSASAQVKKHTCQQVEAVLSDGPEPKADPVGYAEAQILPLRQIHTSDSKLGQAIDTLASAYGAFSASNGASQAKSAVTSASRTIDTLCPGIEL